MSKLTLLLLAYLTPLTVYAEIDKEQQEDLRYLVRQDCGSCHGMTLRGGLGPPLTPAALKDKPGELLINSILLGRPGTAMPAWQGLLDREQAGWIISELRKGMPE